MKIKATLALALAVGALAACTLAAQARVAPSYTSKADGYALWLPGRPQPATHTANVPGAGAMQVRYVSLQAPPISYVVLTTPVPAKGYSAANAKVMLDGIANGFMASSRGKQFSSRAITLGRWPGREVVVAMGPQAGAARMRARVFVTPKRSYQIVAIAPAAALSSKKAQVEKVLGSFQILGQ
jgi:hypothetical protein